MASSTGMNSTHLDRHYKRLAIRLIVLLTLFHALLAATLTLGNDESYYWMYSQVLKSNYFDHPPMVAVFIRLFSLNGVLGDSPFILRLGTVIGNGLASFFLFKMMQVMHNARAGWFATMLYQGSFYASLTAGVYIMPDAPQMVFWTLALWMLVRILRDDQSWASWLILGLAAGFCIMSKVHGGFIWIGVGAFTLFHKRSWLRLPQLYAAALVTLVIISPLLYWNIANGFITYRFHSKRVAIAHFGVEGSSFLREAVGQLFFNNPVNVSLALAALYAFFRSDKKSSFPSLLLWIALPHALFLLFISLFRDTTLPHWSGPAYVTLIPFAACWLASKPRAAWISVVLKTSLSLYLLTMVAWSCLAYVYPGTWGSREEGRYGQGDISLDFYGWREAGKAFSKLYAADTANGTMPPGSPVVFSYWWGAHIQYYFCRRPGIPSYALGNLVQLREYWWYNGTFENVSFTDAYCIMPEDEHYLLPTAFFRSIEPAEIITVHRSGKPAHRFRVYHLRGWNGVLPGRGKL